MIPMKMRRLNVESASARQYILLASRAGTVILVAVEIILDNLKSISGPLILEGLIFCES